MKAVVLVGGFGTRMRPLTLRVPKAMAPLVNVPFVERLVTYLSGSGVEEIALSVCYLPDPIRDHLSRRFDRDLRLLYFHEDQPLGTAGALKNSERVVAGETFLALNGDVLTGINLRKMMEFHLQRNSQITIALTPVENPTAYGIVETEAEGRVVRFLEKPTWEEVTTNTINAGIYILEPEVLELIPAGKPCSIEREVFPQAVEAGWRVHGFPTDDYWIDLGTLDKYLIAHRDLLSGRLAVEIPGDQVAEGIWIGPGAEIDPSAVLEPPVVIGAHCRVAEGARVGPYAVLGDRAVVEEKATIRDCVLWDDVSVGSRAILKDCILGSSCVVNPGATVEGVRAFPNHTTVE